MLHVSGNGRIKRHKGPAFARLRTGNAHPIAGSRILNARLHHASSVRTAHTRTGSPTPFSDGSPLSSNATPAEVRARERTVSDTSTSPGADTPVTHDPMLKSGRATGSGSGDDVGVPS